MRNLLLWIFVDPLQLRIDLAEHGFHRSSSAISNSPYRTVRLERQSLTIHAFKPKLMTCADTTSECFKHRAHSPFIL